MSREPIRILRMITRLDISGPSLHVCLLTNKLSTLDYETILACGPSLLADDDMGYVANEYSVEPIVISEIRYSLNPIRNIVAIRRIYQFIRKTNPDVVHTHARTAGILGRIAAKLAGVPVIVHTFHEYPFEGHFSPGKTQLFINLERIAAGLTDSIITLTEGLRQNVAEKYRIARRGRITVLPMGLDLSRFAQIGRGNGAFRKEWHISLDAPLVGVIGRIIPVKNHKLFLDAAVQIKEQVPDIKFVIVGDGILREETEAYAQKMGIADAVIFTGWQKNVTDIYSDLDVLVISSTNEGTPVPIIEALTAGCPVVATDVGGVSDLLNDGAFGKLVPSGDANKLATAIVDTLQNPPDPEPARSRMLDRYDIDRLAMEMASLYRGLLTKKNQS